MRPAFPAVLWSNSVTDAAESDTPILPLTPSFFQMAPIPRSSTDRLLGDAELYINADEHRASTPDGYTFLSGSESRNQVEKRLLQKLDRRVIFLVFVYILNHVRSSTAMS